MSIATASRLVSPLSPQDVLGIAHPQAYSSSYNRKLNAVAPQKLFFYYYIPGASHAPHHPTNEWVDKIRKMHLFDEGWNTLRKTIFANQKRLGVIPANTKLTPGPKGLLKEWDELTADEKKCFIRHYNQL